MISGLCLRPPVSNRVALGVLKVIPYLFALQILNKRFFKVMITLGQCFGESKF